MTLATRAAPRRVRAEQPDPSEWWQAEIAAADQHEAALRDGLQSAWSIHQTDVWRVAAALATNDSGLLNQRLHLRQIDASVGAALFEELCLGVLWSAEHEALTFAVPVPNTAAITWARQRAAKLVSDISAEQRRSIQEIIANGLQVKRKFEDIAASLEDAIGLHPRYANAVARYRAGLVAAGDQRAGAKARAYAARLRASRALAIARTESMTAINVGKLLNWKARQDLGLLKKNARKGWGVTPDDRLCPTCQKMRGKSVLLGKQFQTPWGALDGPPGHANCRCVVRLIP